MEEIKAENKSIKEFLNQEREILTAKVQELGKDATVNGGYDPNFADSSVVIAERVEAEGQLANLEVALAEVEVALTKLDSNNYGICESCHREIATERLEAIPTTRYCRDCASNHKA
ncbi:MULTISPECIES: TraR/DksA C4-type zinc finger protein [Acidithrix]|jgi:RNA polymerase-binding transcription factor DksA|uniref:General stress protein 16O n=1 Tax=Acidithrix ferrooxidans TaxID=1280514 RepID=A0A0D8HFI1_9ACTN|nr:MULTISPECIES: TraR/DksA C4-type zinc finger protein [Acidithrix]KJF15816.1 general stress protein 16O [Acidithrix ferrooxidans]CAG4905761.1 unnamed protein product [Acidithrix sp. C25]